MCLSKNFKKAKASRFRTAFALLGITTCLHFGCGRSSSTDKIAVLFPESLQIEGLDWKRLPWTPEDDRKLQSYFVRNPSLAENPLLGSEKHAYSNGKGVQRYYWVTPTQDSTVWMYLEFKSNTYSKMGEGEGAPFSTHIPLTKTP